MAKDYSVVRNCVKHRPEKSPSSRFQPTKLFALSLKTNSFHNLSFLPFFFPFWLFTFIFISSPCASHWNLEFFWFTQTSFFVHQKNSRFQCSAQSSFTKTTQDFSVQHQGSLIKLKFTTKNARKHDENSCCSMHLFSAPHNKFCGQKMATKEP